MMKVFIIECPNPNDLLQKREEARSLESICNLFGHEVYTFKVKSKNELVDVLRYIATINTDENCTMAIHVSAHGSNNGLVFGAFLLEWDLLAKIFSHVCSKEMKFLGKRVFVISACMSKYQQLTQKFTELHSVDNNIAPPKYIFVCGDEKISWDRAIVMWTILYHELPNVDLDNKYAIQSILKRIQLTDIGELIYFRWDENLKKYLQFRNKKSLSRISIRKRRQQT